MSHVPAERCLAIIELLADGADAMPLGEIAQRLTLPKSGAHRLLATLVDLGWAEKDPETSFYRLSMRLAVLGQQFYVATGIPDICQPILDRFAQQCREFARLAVVDGHSLVWVAHAQGASGGLVYQPSLMSNTVPLFATASGKAWLATLSTDQAMHYVMKNGGLKDADRYGPNVVRSIEALLRELKATARRGYGLAFSEAEFGVSAVAAAIRAGDAGPALGTVSIAGPSARMTEKRAQDLAPVVLRTAAELSNLWPLRVGAARKGWRHENQQRGGRRKAVA
ncbi:MAG TPA: IclR family transcriptional regulator [Casimicrobiaceae bacterium]|nr:IclR family transcriptional regulator [Casimicrobiaceae bacterium]